MLWFLSFFCIPFLNLQLDFGLHFDQCDFHFIEKCLVFMTFANAMLIFVCSTPIEISIFLNMLEI